MVGECTFCYPETLRFGGRAAMGSNEAIVERLWWAMDESLLVIQGEFASLKGQKEDRAV